MVQKYLQMASAGKGRGISCKAVGSREDILPQPLFLVTKRKNGVKPKFHFLYVAKPKIIIIHE